MKSITITNHAIVRYLERKMNVDLSFYKSVEMNDAQIVSVLDLDRAKIEDEIKVETYQR